MAGWLFEHLVKNQPYKKASQRRPFLYQLKILRTIIGIDFDIIIR